MIIKLIRAIGSDENNKKVLGTGRRGIIHCGEGAGRVTFWGRSHSVAMVNCMLAVRRCSVCGGRWMGMEKLWRKW